MDIKRLTVDNFVTFGLNQSYSFPQDLKKLFVSGVNYDTEGMSVNGIGKTLFFIDAIIFGFTGETARNISVKDLIGNVGDSTTVTIEGSHNDKSIIITRTHDGTKPSVTVSVDGDATLLTKRTATLTTESLFQYFNLDGTPNDIANDLFNTICLTSDSVDLFASSKYTSSDRFDFISRLLNTRKWEELSQNAKEKRKTLKKEIEELASQIEFLQNDTINIEETQKKIDEIQTKIQEKEEEIEKYESQREIVENYSTYQEQEHTLTQELTTLNSNYQIEHQNLIQEQKEIKSQVEQYHQAQQVEKPAQELESIESTVDDLKEQERKYKQQLISIEQQKEEKEKLEESLTQYQEAQEVEQPADSVEIIEKDITDTRSTIQEKQQKQSTLKQEIDELQQGTSLECPQCHESLLYCDDELTISSEEERQEQITEKSNQLEKIQEELNVLQKQKLTLLNEKKAVQKQWDEYNAAQTTLKNLANVPEKIAELEEQIALESNTERQLSAIQDKLQQYDVGTLRNQWQAYTTAQSTIQTLSNIEEKHEKIQEKIQNHTDQYQEKKKLLEEQLQEITTILSENDINNMTVSSLESSIEENKNTIQSLQKQRYHYENQIEQTQKKEQTIQEHQESLKSLQKEVEAYSYWADGFIEIRRLLIQSFLPSFNETSNKLVKQIGYPVHIRLDTLNETQKGKVKEEFVVKITDNYGRERLIDSFSKGERVRLGVIIAEALRQTLQAIQGNQFFNFVVYDEILDGLDQTGIEYFIRMIQQSDALKIFISHNPELQRFFPNMIEIQKKNGVSTISK